MNRPVVLIVLLLVSGCIEKLTREDLTHLNGYWEIEKVKFPDGTNKEFKVNATIDYIELKGTSGFRKKVQPKFDGTYSTSNDAENFSIREKQGIFTMRYQNNMSEWEERIETVSPDNMVLVNMDTITYYYKRFQPIVLK